MSELEPPLPPPGHSLTLHDGLLGRLRDMIIEGEWAPGTRLRERELTEWLGVSRTPLREALKVLAAERLIELTPNRGARVASLGEAEIRHMFELMGALEALAGRLAAERVSEADLLELNAMHLQMRAHYVRRDLPAYFRLNQAIHRRIVAAAGNPLLAQSYDQLAGRIRRPRFLASQWSPERWAQAVEEHEAIMVALTRRDGALLAQLLEAHLAHKAEALLAHLTPDAVEQAV
ncbi:transcriptional regulator [Aliidongia dinghuensis]|uniref:Transcriptional regulator n=1 Tax=Aliidongia dinghuensis TaxID=1867774 RepID=A0A8J2YUC5_9PROT|nr:GntR family transcriptional regulator [Aliidongia dinghuensis]GGF23318.1 transcriptional regulator [Aliidongia dinghuensis]